jgi:ABC-type phosphate transport system substrate-binding protein
LLRGAGQSIDMSYRGVGSSAGKVEFLAGNTAFGCSEIPVSDAELATFGSSVLQMPLVIGAMSVFHSIPAEHTGTDGLELSPCMLGKIFSRQVTMWDDEALREGGVNSALASVDQPITVFRRTKGSSTTNFFTRYLYDSTRANTGDSCEDAWPMGWGPALHDQDDVDDYPFVLQTWATGTTAVEGSGGMSANIRSTPYSIGYIDSGHGHADGLVEVKLKNKAGNWLDSLEAGPSGIMAAASSTDAGLPTAAADTGWEGVNIINQPGANTWPIVAFSYLLVKQDLSAETEPNVAAATKAYLELTMHPDGGQDLASKYNFVGLPSNLLLQNNDAIAGITLPAGDTEFVWEWQTESTTGPAAGTLSVKRKSHTLELVNKHEEELQLITGTSGSLAAVEAKIRGEHSSLPLEMHGSGTTNPSKMIWKMMATLKGMAMRPLHLSYRAIGSSSGIAEFLAGKSHFGSAEIPLTPAEVTGTGSNVLQIPLVLGAMSAFHSVPDSDLGPDGLHLTPCMLAKIFSRQATMWNDPEIVALNPDADLPAEPIVMLHRKKGSSTTNFFTKYLHTVTRAGANDCEAAWTLGWGAALTSDEDVAKYEFVNEKWAADSDTVITCEGSGKMASNLASIPYAIGYIDSGHGHADGLSEIKLQNAAGNFIDSSMAGDNGVMAAAASATIPTTAAGDWSTVNLLNIEADASAIAEYFEEDGVDKTWPIVAISYLFVKDDLTYLGETGAAVKAFLQYSQSTEKGYSTSKGAQHFASEFKFTALPETMLTISQAGIDSITLAPGVEEFDWEWSTDTDIGSSRMTLSCKRSNWDTYGISMNSGAIGAAAGTEPAVVAPAAAVACEQMFGAGALACQGVDDAMGVAIAALVMSISTLIIMLCILIKLCTTKNDTEGRSFGNMSRQSDDLSKGAGGGTTGV